MHGDSPLTERLYRPVLIDAETGELTARPRLPGYMTTLLLSQPLHLGDYGALPLKVLWALLDLMTILVLVSGLYLWFKRGSTETRIAEIERRPHQRRGSRPLGQGPLQEAHRGFHRRCHRSSRAPHGPCRCHHRRSR